MQNISSKKIRADHLQVGDMTIRTNPKHRHNGDAAIVLRTHCNAMHCAVKVFKLGGKILLLCFFNSSILDIIGG